MAASARRLGLATAVLMALHTSPAAASRFVFTALAPPNAIDQSVNITGVYQDQAVGWMLTNDGFTSFVWSAGNYIYLPGIKYFARISDSGLVLGYSQDDLYSSYTTYDLASGVTNDYNLSPTGYSGFGIEGINANGTVAVGAETTTGRNGKKGFYCRTFEQASNGSYVWLSKQKRASKALFPVGLENDGTAVLGAVSSSGGPYVIAKNGQHKTFSVSNSEYTDVTFVGGDRFGGYFLDAKTKHYVGFVSHGGKVVTYAPSQATDAIVMGVGTRGEVVGYTIDASENNVGFIYFNANYYPILYPKSRTTTLSGISSTGAIIGTYYDDAGIRVNFIATCPSQKVCTQ